MMQSSATALECGGMTPLSSGLARQPGLAVVCCVMPQRTESGVMPPHSKDALHHDWVASPTARHVVSNWDQQYAKYGLTGRAKKYALTG